MLKYYIRIAFRSVKRNPFYAAISIVGLVIGMAAYVLLTNYTQQEKSFDNFHADKDKIYRVESYFEKNGQVTDSWATSSFGYATAMKKEMPEVKDVVRVNNYDCERVVRYKEKIYREPRVVFADSNFFRFFSYPLLEGNIHKVLREPNSIVISESAAKKYFGNENPIGKILHVSTIMSKYDCAVTGVFKNFPINSTLQYDLMMSYMTTTPFERDFWYMHQAYTYVKVDGSANAVSVERKFPALAEKYKTAVTMKEHKWGVYLVSLESIHLNPVKPYELEEKGSATTINMLAIIAFVVLVISWINYINLFISRAMERAGEIGIRKMAGASYTDILLQFITEALLVNLIAFLLFFALMAAVIPIASLFSLEAIFTGFWHNPLTWKMSFAAFAAGTVITGFIPAIILKSINTAHILKNKLAFRSGLGHGLRKGLIVFQYFASVVLIVATLTIHKQVKFMQSQNLGIATAQTLVFKTPPKTDDRYDEKMRLLTQELTTIGGVTAVTQSSAVPGKMAGYGLANRRVGAPDNTNKICDMLRVDYDFIPAYNVELLSGRNFSKSYPTDKDDAVILTESAMQLLGFASVADAMNGAIYLEGHENRKFKVIGIAKDYHQQSVKEGFQAIVFIVYNPWDWINNHYVSVKLSAGLSQQTVEKVRRQFSAVFPDSSFDFFFLDEYFNRQYLQDVKYGQMILFFSLLALFIVCLGIMGMSGFMLLKRKKEIGIRKVNGAGTFAILQLLNSHFLKLLLVAFGLAIPVAWLSMYYWLQNYPSRTTVGVPVFVIAVGVTAFITIVTVTVQSYKTAATKPIEALRYE